MHYFMLNVPDIGPVSAINGLHPSLASTFRTHEILAIRKVYVVFLNIPWYKYEICLLMKSADCFF